MKNNSSWPIELGTSGVLSSGRWLQLRAILWAVLLSAGAMAFFLSTQYLGSWLHLPPNSSYIIVLGIPLLAFIAYAAVVAGAEGRRPVEVLPHIGMIAEIPVGALRGCLMLCAITTQLWSLGL